MLYKSSCIFLNTLFRLTAPGVEKGFVFAPLERATSSDKSQSALQSAWSNIQLTLREMYFPFQKAKRKLWVSVKRICNFCLKKKKAFLPERLSLVDTLKYPIILTLLLLLLWDSFTLIFASLSGDHGVRAIATLRGKLKHNTVQRI